MQQLFKLKESTYLKAKVIQEVQKDMEDSLELSIGEHVYIVNDSDVNIWYGESVRNGTRGRFPSSSVGKFQ